MAKKDYSNWSKEELVRELKKVEKRKKYGMVWEDKPEKVAELCKEKLPVLEEDTKKEIKTDDKKPVNILIEGDNYHALSVLNYTNKGLIDVIYIDPPYNTGKKKEWKYNDHYVDKEDSYRHSKWLDFMSKRLKLAKPLLRNNGLIFISIDDNEIAQLKLLCDWIFGEKNLVANFVWRTAGNFDNQAKVKICHEYILCYAKNIKNIKAPKIIDPNIDVQSKLFKDEIRNTIVKNGPKNPISEIRLPPGMPASFKEGVIKKRDTAWPHYDKDAIVKDYQLQNEILIKSGWSSKNLFETFLNTSFSPVVDIKGQESLFEISTTGAIEVVKKRSEDQSHVLSVLTNLGNTQSTSQFLKKIGVSFTYPKPVELIKYLINMNTSKNPVVLDFFAGSGTTGQSLLEINKEFKKNGRFILCTNNEDSNGDGNKILSDICYPRLKKVIRGDSFIAKLGGNLKYFKTDFVDAGPTDENKRKMVDKSTEMLCLKEDCFEEVMQSKKFGIFKNVQEKYLGIIYDDDGIEPFKKEAKKLKKQFVVYVFSLDESAREDEFEDVYDLVELRPIPAVILNVYKRIFK
ncbi:site-specific DNA-methyltransferase [Candidatus Woesearchaeota archaeon]|nr:site-specific DNA-methyltransferase [Candidatus Woesearchaeota archaeon]